MQVTSCGAPAAEPLSGPAGARLCLLAVQEAVAPVSLAVVVSVDCLLFPFISILLCAASHHVIASIPVFISCFQGGDEVSSRAESFDDYSSIDDDSSSSTYYYTAMPITPSHQQTARTKLSSSVRISTHQILAALMCREPQSIRQIHDLLSQLNKEHEAEIAGLTTTRRTSHSAVEQAARSTTPSVLISEQQILAILDVSIRACVSHVCVLFFVFCFCMYVCLACDLSFFVLFNLFICQV
jgi:hypothetical protein